MAEDERDKLGMLFMWGGETHPCLVCDGDAPFEKIRDKMPIAIFLQVTCQSCGRYRVTREAVQTYRKGLTDFIKERRYLLAGLIRHHKGQYPTDFFLLDKQFENGDVFKSEVIDRCPHDMDSKAFGILQYFSEKSEYPGQGVSYAIEAVTPYGYCKHPNEAQYYLNYLEEAGLIEGVKSAVVTITFKGWEYIRTRRQGNHESTRAFVAMAFVDDLMPIFENGIKPVEEDTGFAMVRIDYVQFNGDIRDKILAEIRGSRFIIADVTQHRNGVYFEAGFAMGLGLPVIWCCKASDMDNAHFDTRQFNHILWSTAEELREKLKNRIVATIGYAKPSTQSTL